MTYDQGNVRLLISVMFCICLSRLWSDIRYSNRIDLLSRIYKILTWLTKDSYDGSDSYEEKVQAKVFSVV